MNIFTFNECQQEWGRIHYLRVQKKNLVRTKSIYINGIDETRDRSFTLKS